MSGTVVGLLKKALATYACPLDCVYRTKHRVEGRCPRVYEGSCGQVARDALESAKVGGLLPGLTSGSRVRMTERFRELEVGDTGTVEAAWKRAMVAVRWDKDKMLRPVNRKRMEMVE
jgi:hypothetical protein